MIELTGLTKSYGGKKVLNNVSFSAKDGCVTGFVGPNGAGKSTTMRMVVCLERPDAGTALVDGVPFDQASNPVRTMGTYLGQGYLPSHMTGKEYLSYVCDVAGVSRQRVSELLQMVELVGSENKQISSYSLGMKQRAGIAAALAGDPTTLMLDEPVNGLDPMGVQWLRDVLRKQASAGKAVLLSSHLLSELELVADYVVMLDKGRVVSQGAMDELELDGNGSVIVATTDDQAMRLLLQKAGADVRDGDHGLIVGGLTARDVGKVAFEGGLLVEHLEQRRSSLEEVFMATAARSQQEGE